MKRKPRRKPAYSTYTAPLDVALIAQRTDPWLKLVRRTRFPRRRPS